MSSSEAPYRTDHASTGAASAEERVAQFIRSRGRPVTVPEICAALLLTPDAAYRAVTFLVGDGVLKPVPESRERQLELAAKD